MTHGVDLNQIGLQPNAQHQREGNWASILEKSEAPERRGVWGAGRPRGPSAGSLYGGFVQRRLCLKHQNAGAN
jgi:hypothetical protein